MKMTPFNILLKSLEWTLYFGLCLTSFAFIWQAMVQYQSKDTSFKMNEVPITDFPTITFCLEPPNFTDSDHGPPYEYILGSEFKISYYANEFWFKIDSTGPKFNNHSLEEIFIEQIATNFVCYKINSTAPNMIGSVRGFNLTFRKSLPEEKLPKKLYFYVTSEQNAYSVTFQKRMNGKVLKHEMAMGNWVSMSINVEKFQYLKEKLSCSDKSFWELWEPIYSNYPGFEKCPKKCAAVSLPNNRQVVYKSSSFD